MIKRCEYPKCENPAVWQISAECENAGLKVCVTHFNPVLKQYKKFGHEVKFHVLKN
jgi:hypothetical protein